MAPEGYAERFLGWEGRAEGHWDLLRYAIWPDEDRADRMPPPRIMADIKSNTVEFFKGNIRLSIDAELNGSFLLGAAVAWALPRDSEILPIYDREILDALDYEAAVQVPTQVGDVQGVYATAPEDDARWTDDRALAPRVYDRREGARDDNSADCR